MAWSRFTDGVLTLHLHLQPGAKSDRVEGLHAERLKVRIKAPAVENRANDYLVRFLAEHFAVPRASVSITGGRQSRKKTVRIDNPQHWPDWFTALAATPGRYPRKAK